MRLMPLSIVVMALLEFFLPLLSVLLAARGSGISVMDYLEFRQSFDSCRLVFLETLGPLLVTFALLKGARRAWVGVALLAGLRIVDAFIFSYFNPGMLSPVEVLSVYLPLMLAGIFWLKPGLENYRRMRRTTTRDRTPRYQVALGGVLYSAGRARTITLRELSIKGAFIECPPIYYPGDRAALEFQYQGSQFFLSALVVQKQLIEKDRSITGIIFNDAGKKSLKTLSDLIRALEICQVKRVPSRMTAREWFRESWRASVAGYRYVRPVEDAPLSARILSKEGVQKSDHVSRSA